MIPLGFFLLMLAPAAPAPAPEALPEVRYFAAAAAAGAKFEADPAPSIESLVAKIKDLRKQQAELAKSESAATDALRAELAKQQAMIDELKLSGPAPKPPAPVDPPADDLATKLTAAFAADAGEPAKKKADALDLAAMMRSAVKICDEPAKFPDVVTVDNLISKLKNGNESFVEGRMLKLREALTVEMKAVLGAKESKLTDATRKAAADLFGRVAAVLESLGK